MIELNKMNVLVVDDMLNMCKSIRGMLKVLNYGREFFFATNGQEAYDVLKNNTIDLVITDWNMPVMSGVELLNKIREDRELRDMPVVMVTAESNASIVAEAAESHIDAYLLKPLTVKSLGDRIQKVIENANHPPPMVFHLKKARDYEEDGRLDKAIEEARRAMIAEPKSTWPLRELGYYYFKKNDLETAEKYLLSAATKNEVDVFAFHRLGDLYLRKNNIEKAEFYFEKAMNISPRHVGRGVEFGKILLKRGMTKRAAVVFDKALEYTDEPDNLKESLIDDCINYRNYEYAIKLINTLLIKQPERLDLKLKMADIYDKKGDDQSAIKYLLEIEQLDNKNVQIKIRIAKKYLKTDQPIRADQILQAALEIDPKNPEARELLRQTV